MKKLFATMRAIGLTCKQGDCIRAGVLASLLAGCVGGIAEYNGPDAPTFEPYDAAERPRVALVLGAGGPRGFAHIGVLKVLEENGIEADLVVGASVGAMIGALYADHMPAAAIEQIALDLDPKRFIGISTRGLAGDGGAIEAFINERTGRKPLEGFRRKLAVTASILGNNTLTIFNRGNTAAAVRASSATPGQFAPVRIRSVEYHDGDEAEPVPIRVARELGARMVIAVDVSAYVHAIPTQAPANWATRDRARAAKVANQAVYADVLIHPDLGYYAGISEEYRRMCIQRGEAAARAALPKIREVLSRQQSELVAAHVPHIQHKP
ncbi:MAG: patatin-like phospholipase family protein [Betaproteobacteria bacterium]|nr:patatin-like phospholipase family protein [Betaproteobacteria bacterium]